MKKSYEGSNILDIDFDNLEKNQEFDDTQKLYDDDLEPSQEEIKIEINKDINYIYNNSTNNNNKNGETHTNMNTMASGTMEEEQENLISNLKDIIKNEAKILSEDGNLISKIKKILVKKIIQWKNICPK